jgi:hypothetical protein
LENPMSEPAFPTDETRRFKAFEIKVVAKPPA